MAWQDSTPSSPEKIVDTVAKAISERHPELASDLVRAEVAHSYRRLAAGSRIADHLPVLVQHEVLERLRTVPGT